MTAADATAKTPPAEPVEPLAAPPPFLVSASPHLRDPDSIPRIMWTVSFTLLPALACGAAVFGPRVLWVALLGAVTAVVTEAACQRWRHKPVTIHDGSAFLTGLLTACVLPVHEPWYVPVLGAFFAIAVVKQTFGGLGCNVWNPALMGRAFVLAAWTPLLTVGAGWPVPHYYKMGRPKVQAKAGSPSQSAVDAVTAATPLSKVKTRLERFNKGKTGDLAPPRSAAEARQALARLQDETATPLADLFLGRRGGCIGEVGALALLIGGIALIALGHVRWQVPVFFIGTVALLSWALPIPVQGEKAQYLVWFAGRPLFEILAGGLFLGAFYMATDMVTSPYTPRGLVLFAVGCGLFTTLIRRYGGYPEGVCYAILLMNTATPLINRHTKPRVFGQREKTKP